MSNKDSKVKNIFEIMEPIINSKEKRTMGVLK